MAGMAGMDMGGASDSSAAPYVAAMHVGALQVDSLSGGMHMHGGGSWAGHAIPAGFFLLWGSYWACNAVSGVAAAGATRTPFRARAWYPFLPRALPAQRWPRLRLLEPTLKVALPCFGAFCELYFHPGGSRFNAIWLRDGSALDPGHGSFWMHACMYFCFALSGVVDLFAARLLPPGASFAALAGAFAAEAFLFYFHQTAQTGFLQEIHLLLVVAIALCAAATALEGATSNGLAALARAYFTLLQGSWFAQICHAVYGNRKWPDDMASAMFAPVYFCLHLLWWAAAFLLGNAAWAHYEHGAVLAARGGALWLPQREGEAAVGAGAAAKPGDAAGGGSHV
jgi:hypothetical protein